MLLFSRSISQPFIKINQRPKIKASKPRTKQTQLRAAARAASAAAPAEVRIEGGAAAELLRGSCVRWLVAQLQIAAIRVVAG